MKEFSIDLNFEKIYFKKTKEYFTEVIKSYYNNNFRSAIVMLYSITVADLVYKLTELRDNYNDTVSKDILDEIIEMQKRNPNSPDWESKLIELINKNTNILEPSDFLHITTLQKHRHLCAHPVLTQNFELYNPNRETVRSHIRNILEGILTKSPLLSRKIFDDFLQDITDNKHILSREQLDRFLNEKYFSRLNNDTIEKIFKSLWKITFKINNKTCNDNRRINFEVIKIMLKRYSDFLLPYIETEKTHFSEINDENIFIAIGLLNDYNKIFENLNEVFRIKFESIIEKDLDLKALSLFKNYDNIEFHISEIYNYPIWGDDYENFIISINTLLEINKYLKKLDKDPLINIFNINMFGKSNYYDMADERYEYLIKANLDKFNEDEFKLLVEKINENSQIYYRRKANETNKHIKEVILKRYPTFDFTNYENFNRNCS